MKKRPVRKTAANSKTTSEDVAKQYLQVIEARNRFIAVSLNMGWRMAIAFIVPIIIGVKVDEHFKSSPSYTLAAFMIGVFLSALIVRDTIREVNEEQAEEEALEAAQSKGKKKGD